MEQAEQDPDGGDRRLTPLAILWRRELALAWGRGGGPLLALGFYAAVIAIDAAKLPTAEAVKGWTSEQFVAALRHDPANPAFNPSLRQLVHVGFKVAAQMGDRYLKMLRACEPTIAKNVTENLYERHLKPLFLKG